MSGPINAYLVANARYHDTDFAALELLKLLAEHDNVQTKVSDSFANVEAIAESDFLITYTCDLRPTAEQESALKDWECLIFCVSVIWSMLSERSKDYDNFPRTAGRAFEGLRAA